MSLEKVSAKLKITKTRVVIFCIILAIALLLQVWDNYNSCLQLFCKPLVLSIFYYLVWPIEFLNLGIIMNINPVRWILVFDRIVVLVLQIFYWYVLSCLISVPVGKKIDSYRLKQGEKEQKIQENIEGKIKVDIEHSEDLEKEKALKKEMSKIKKLHS